MNFLKALYNKKYNQSYLDQSCILKSLLKYYLCIDQKFFQQIHQSIINIDKIIIQSRYQNIYKKLSLPIKNKQQVVITMILLSYYNIFNQMTNCKLFIFEFSQTPHNQKVIIKIPSSVDKFWAKLGKIIIIQIIS
ncbi:hypothetical protein pb186bvf_012730 [Paramecium bursaria]